MLDKTRLSQREDLDITDEYIFSSLYVCTIGLNFISVQMNIDRLLKNMISFQYIFEYVGQNITSVIMKSHTLQQMSVCIYTCPSKCLHSNRSTAYSSFIQFFSSADVLINTSLKNIIVLKTTKPTGNIFLSLNICTFHKNILSSGCMHQLNQISV